MARFELPVQNFLITKLRENFPDINLREGSAFRDMLVKPATLLFQPFRDQVQILKRNTSISNFSLMLDDEFDQLVSNFFVERREGDLASGIVRAFYNVAQDSLINTTTAFFTEDGRIYNPTSPVAVTAAEMALNIEGNLFFVDIAVQSSETGANKNADIGEVSFVSSGPAGIVQVTNSNPITAGTNRETNTRLYSRTKSSIAVRDLVTKRAITAVLLETFTSIRELRVFGFGDTEMERDISPVAITGQEQASGVGTGATPLIVATDTDMDSTVALYIFTSAAATFLTDGIKRGMRLDVVAIFGAAGTIIEEVVDENTLRTSQPAGSTMSGLTYSVTDLSNSVFEDLTAEFTELMEGSAISLSGTAFTVHPLHDTIVSEFLSPTRLKLGVGYPEDVTTPELDYTITSVANIENIHTGGKVDVYLDTNSLAESDILVQVPADLKVWVNRIVQDGEVVLGESTLTTEIYDFLANGVTLDDQLELLEGPNVGVYDIDTVGQFELDVDIPGGWPRDEKGTRFRIIRSFYIDGEPFNVPVINGVSGVQLDPGDLSELADLGVGGIVGGTVLVGVNGQGAITSNILEDNTVDFVALGVEEGFRLVMPDPLLELGGNTLGTIIEVIDSNNIRVEPATGTGTWSWTISFNTQAYEILDPPPNDFTLVSVDPDTRFSPLQDTYFLFDSQWVGSYVKITYAADATVLSSQDFADSDDERVVAADILIKRAWPAFVDIAMEYRGSIEEVDLEAILADFINSTDFDDGLEKSDIIAYLYSFNVNFATTNFTWSATVLTNEDASIFVTDSNVLEIPRLAHFIARNIELTKTGE